MTPSLLMPAGLRAGESYWIYGDPNDPRSEQIKSLLAWASPQARCLGLGRAPVAKGTIVLFEAEFLDLANALAAEGIASDRIRCLPIPENYPWAYWDVWGWFASRPDLRLQQSSFEAYKHAVAACPYLGGSQMAAQIQSWASLADRHLYWGEHRAYLQDHKANLEQVSEMLADDKSRELYELVIRSDPEELWVRFVEYVYRACDYLEHDRPRAGETVLNLGIFSGHELPYFLTLLEGGGTIYDVDPVGHDLLSEYARACVKTRAQSVHEVRVAAGARRTTEHFKLYGDGQMCLTGKDDPDAKITFDITPLDDYVEKHLIDHISFIKIDIEGMEPDALTGMQRTIKHNRPTLSLAIYHTPEHMWALPLRLMRELDQYDFYIDHFSPARVETILTAVPKERMNQARESWWQAVSHWARQTRRRLVKLMPAT